MSRLLVIVSDRISNIIKKGELIEEYYNPGNFFDEVGILLTNDDVPNLDVLQKSVGTAKLTIFNVPTGSAFLFRTLGWRPFLLKTWAKKGVQLAKEYDPTLIRCYGNRLSGFLASQIKETLRVPYILSMHEDTDDIVRIEHNFARTFQYRLLESMGIRALKNADCVIAVFESIVKGLQRRGVEKYVVIHNSVNGKHLIKKPAYHCDDRSLKLLYVGRILGIKNPECLIRAVAQLENVTLDVIGDGSLQPKMVEVVDKLGCSDRIRFRKSVNNDDLCEMLCDYDVLAVNYIGAGVPKTVIEAWLAALPVLTNIPMTETKEYENMNNIVLVENDTDGYKQGIEWFMDEINRERIGRTGCAYANEFFSPEKCRKQVIELYKEILGV